MAFFYPRQLLRLNFYPGQLLLMHSDPGVSRMHSPPFYDLTRSVLNMEQIK